MYKLEDMQQILPPLILMGPVTCFTGNLSNSVLCIPFEIFYHCVLHFWFCFATRYHVNFSGSILLVLECCSLHLYFRPCNLIGMMEDVTELALPASILNVKVAVMIS